MEEISKKLAKDYCRTRGFDLPDWARLEIVEDMVVLSMGWDEMESAVQVPIRL
jgi:hypothetical protein